ncbi:hypothetical protein [Priestia sp. GS2]|uniref:hypothetical protein n=1 Tax=Priestia sp. GS2 TaxID=3117403 RepID=UPI002ED77A4B
MKHLIIILFTAFLVTACNQGNNSQEAQSKKEWAELENYEEFTDQNPNFLNTTNKQTAVKDDAAKIEEIINVKTPYKPGNIVISGKDAWVTVYVGKEYNVHEKKKIIKNLNEAFYEGLPRLQFHVNVKP